MRHTFHQVLQFFCFPAVKAVIVDFYDAFQMADAKDKFLLQFHNIGEYFLVVQPGIVHKTDRSSLVQLTGRREGLFQLFILADKISGWI